MAFYAIGVFTGFTLAGFGMARYFRRTASAGGGQDRDQHRVGAVVGAVVVIFAVTKFTEGAWLVVLVVPDPGGPAAAAARTYRAEARRCSQGGARPRPIAMLRTSYTVLILVDKVDLAVRALH